MNENQKAINPLPVEQFVIFFISFKLLPLRSRKIEPVYLPYRDSTQFEQNRKSAHKPGVADESTGVFTLIITLS